MLELVTQNAPECSTMVLGFQNFPEGTPDPTDIGRRTYDPLTIPPSIRRFAFWPYSYCIGKLK